MEIPVISRISGFESEINRLQNHPSLFSRLINQSGIGEIFQIYGVWTLGALILAFLATFSTLIRRTKLLIFRFRKPKLVNSQQLLHSSSSITTETDDDDDDDDDDETDDETCSAASSDSTSSLDQQDDFTVKGGGGGSSLSNSFSWKDFVNGKAVVKSWDGLALGFGGSSGGNLLSFSDFGNGVRVGGRCQFPMASMPSPSVFVSAGFENSKKVALKIWDTRTGRQIPEIFAERQPRWQSVCGGGPVVVGDLRKLNSPLEGLTESEGKGTWWDADAAIVDGDHEQLCGLDWKDGGSVVSRCRNAILSCFSLDKMGNSI